VTTTTEAVGLPFGAPLLIGLVDTVAIPSSGGVVNVQLLLLERDCTQGAGRPQSAEVTG